MPLKLGSLSRRLRLQRQDATSSTGYTTVQDVWGALEFRSSGGEGMQSGGPQAVATYLIRLWYRTDIRASWQIVDLETGRTFQIGGYGDPDGTKTEMHLMCSEVLA